MGSIEQPFVLEILKLDNVFTVMGYFPEASELLPNPNAVEEDTQLVRRCRGIYEHYRFHIKIPSLVETVSEHMNRSGRGDRLTEEHAI